MDKLKCPNWCQLCGKVIDTHYSANDKLHSFTFEWTNGVYPTVNVFIHDDARCT